MMTFRGFAAINRQRCEAPDGFDRRLDSSPLSCWALGITEEAGEVAGVVRAIEFSGYKQKTHQDLADEIADVVSYCDLLAQRIGRNLDDILRDKWNRVSERIGSPLRLEPGFGKADTGPAFLAVMGKARDELTAAGLVVDASKCSWCGETLCPIPNCGGCHSEKCGDPCESL